MIYVQSRHMYYPFFKNKSGTLPREHHQQKTHKHTQVQTGSQRESEIEVDFQRKGYFEYKILKGFWGNFSINFFLQAQKKTKIT